MVVAWPDPEIEEGNVNKVKIAGHIVCGWLCWGSGDMLL